MVPTSANLSRNRTQFQARVDSSGGYRTSLDLNRMLISRVLPVRASAAFQHDGFIRKPSGVNNVRYKGMVKYRPFRKTTIAGNYSGPRPQIREYSAKFNTRYTVSGLSDNRILKNISVSGSLRWASKGAIGFFGKGYTPGMDLTLAANRILQLDPTRPIYSSTDGNIDVFVNYRTSCSRTKSARTSSSTCGTCRKPAAGC